MTTRARLRELADEWKKNGSASTIDCAWLLEHLPFLLTSLDAKDALMERMQRALKLAHQTMVTDKSYGFRPDTHEIITEALAAFEAQKENENG